MVSWSVRHSYATLFVDLHLRNSLSHVWEFFFFYCRFEWTVGTKHWGRRKKLLDVLGTKTIKFLCNQTISNKINKLRSNINKKLVFDSTISETNTCRIKVWGLLPLNKHTSFRIIIPAKVLWKYSITYIEKSITPSIRIIFPLRTDFRFYKNIKFLLLSGKLYSSFI